MARERLRFDRTTGEWQTIEQFGPPIAEKPLDFNSTSLLGGIRVIRDLEPYISPIDRKIVNSRSEHRDHMRRHDVVEFGNQPLRPRERQKLSEAKRRDDIKRAMAMVKEGYRPSLGGTDE